MKMLLKSVAIALNPVSPAIPYRTDVAVSSSSLIGALLITVLVLTALVCALLYFRKRGWLGVMSTKRKIAAEDAIEIKAFRRISVASTAHVLAYQGRLYMVVESTRGTVSTMSLLDQRSALADGER